MNKTYVPLHVHTDLSLLDSCSNFKDYIDFCVDNGLKAICFTEHGNIYQHFAKRKYCEEKGIKYLHGCEFYITKTLNENIRDNYHTILIAKNKKGFQELNLLIELSTRPDHVYYKNRISIEEFLNISDNIIKISGCLQSPLNHKDEIGLDIFQKLCKHYDYYEIQHHNTESQKEYNKEIYELSLKYNKPIVATGDFHSVSEYKAECRKILLKEKHIEYSNEDDFDLVIKTYDEFVNMFKTQNSLDESVYQEAMENTNKISEMCEKIIDDYSIKYPIVSSNDEEELKKLIITKYKEKVKKGIIKEDKRYLECVKEEFRVFKKVDMLGFMLFMSQLCTWSWQNNIPTGFCRGSVRRKCYSLPYRYYRC